MASPNVKVIVVGNPCNTKYGRLYVLPSINVFCYCHVWVVACPWCSALICMKNAPNIPAKNFHALTRLDENRAKCQVPDVGFLLFLVLFPQQTNRLSNHTQSPFVASTKSRRVLWQSIKHDYLGEPLNNSGEDMIMNDQAFADTFFSLIVGNLVLITMHRFLISWMPKLMGDQRKKSLRIQSG